MKKAYSTAYLVSIYDKKTNSYEYELVDSKLQALWYIIRYITKEVTVVEVPKI